MYKSIAKRYGAPSNAKPLKRNLKPVPEGNKGLGKLPEPVRNKMGFMRMKDGSQPREMPNPMPDFDRGLKAPFKRNGGKGNQKGKSKMVSVEYIPADGSEPYMIDVSSSSPMAEYAAKHGAVPGGIYGRGPQGAGVDPRRSGLSPQESARRQYEYIVANPDYVGGKGSDAYLASTQKYGKQAGILQRKKSAVKRTYKKKK